MAKLERDTVYDSHVAVWGGFDNGMIRVVVVFQIDYRLSATRTIGIATTRGCFSNSYRIHGIPDDSFSTKSPRGHAVRFKITFYPYQRWYYSMVLLPISGKCRRR